MNDEMVMHYTVMDTLEMAGWAGQPLALVTLALSVLGVICMIKRLSLSGRWGFTIAACLPFLIGVSGTVTGMMSAFATLKTRGLADGSRFFAAMAEVALPFSIGLFCSALVMTLAFLVWLRGPRPGEP